MVNTAASPKLKAKSQKQIQKVAGRFPLSAFGLLHYHIITLSHYHISILSHYAFVNL
jgi:hypothetical protein